MPDKLINSLSRLSSSCRSSHTPLAGPVIIWGGGSNGKAAFNILRRHGEKITAFIDTDPQLKGTHIHGVEVFSPWDLPGIRRNELIIIASLYKEEIGRQLSAMGYSAGQDWITIIEYGSGYDPFGEQPPESFVDQTLSILSNFGNLTGKNILHIGSGPFLGTDIALLIAGAASVTSIDIINIPWFPDITRAFAHYHDFLVLFLNSNRFSVGCPNARSFNLDQLIYATDNRLYLNDEKLKFNCCSAEDLPYGNDHFDFAFSTAVLEHVEHPEAAIKEVFRVLKPGGMTFHQIDTRDHRDFRFPYHHLYLSRAEWRDRQAIYDFCSGNQYRGCDFFSWFKKSGFYIEQFTPQFHSPGQPEYEPIDPELVHPDFSEYDIEELKPLNCFIKALRPG